MDKVQDSRTASQRHARSILNTHSQVTKPTLARRLEVLADCELQHGHVAAAERLAWRAAELRGGGQ